MITFTAYGVPAPQGSTKAFMRRGMKFPVVTADCKRTKPWRQAVVDASREHLAGRGPLEGPVEVRVVFYLPRPKSAPKRITEPAKLPDLDKLVRALGDALTSAGVWHDDAQVVSTLARKAFAAGIHDPEGAMGIPRAVVTAYEVPHRQAGECP
jgi:Holliday junction resolvase RusA-like endonuclease